MGLSERERRVCGAIRAREGALLDDLRVHVGLATGGRDVAGLDETRGRLVSRAVALGAKVEMIPGVARPAWLHGERLGLAALPTVVCRRNGGDPRGAGRREALIAGHLDTVHDPGGPFGSLTVSVDGTRATGPGCVDMKGGLVIAMGALEALEECGEALSWTLLLNSDEETGSYHSAPAIRGEAARVASAGGIGIALEPATADGGLVVERAGSGQFLVEVEGRAAHVGRDIASGRNAVECLARLVHLHIAPMNAWDRGLIVNSGIIDGGTATNVVPDRARLWGNFRFPTEADGALLQSRLRAMADAMPEFRVRVEADCNRPAKPETAEVRAFGERAHAAAEDLRQALTFGKTAGVCDGNLMQAAGLPTLDTLGVRGGGLHTEREWIEIPSLVERCQLLAVTMMRVCGT